MRIKWVQQDDATGCATACFAMIMGKSYKEIKEELKNLHQGGLTTKQIDAYLAEKGYFVSRLFKYSWVTDETRPEWPVYPSRICLADVVNDTEIGDTHIVVVVDGVVLDPGDVNKKSLSEYHRVISVAGVCKPHQRKQKKIKNGN